ncbi:hypothetical protein Plhal304r1_c002g0007731 [Plasmopara halstedii]
MASKTMVRFRGARGQLVLYNPEFVPFEVAQELDGMYGYQPREAVGCLADVMISQRKGKFPPAAFILINKDTPNFSFENIIDRLRNAEKAFQHAFAIAIFPIPQFAELQLLAISKSIQIKLFPVFSLSHAVKLMVSIYEKLAYDITTMADEFNKRVNDELLTRKHALDTLKTNFPFLTLDECDMLLDLFGSLASIAQAGAEKLLDVTVLSTSTAHAIEEFFGSEYVAE